MCCRIEPGERSSVVVRAVGTIGLLGTLGAAARANVAASDPPGGTVPMLVAEFVV